MSDMGYEAQSTVVRGQSELQKAQTIAYARLRLEPDASLSQVIEAINRREQIRGYMRSTAAQTQSESEYIYEAGITRGIQRELKACLESVADDELVALKAFAQALESVQKVTLSDERVEKLDEAFLSIALETLTDPVALPIEKAASVTLSLGFAAKQRGADKTKMILAQRLTAEQAAGVSHINPASQLKAERQLAALKEYFDFAGLEYHTETVDSTLSASAQKAAQLAKEQLAKSRQAFDDGLKMGQKVASVSVIAGMGIVGNATATAAAEIPSASSQAEVSIVSEVPVVQPIIIGDKIMQQVPMVATVEDTVTVPTMQATDVKQTPTVSVEGSVENINSAEIPVAPVVDVTNQESAAPKQVRARAGVETPPKEEEAKQEPLPSVVDDPVETRSPTPEVVEVEPGIEDIPIETEEEAPEPPVSIVPPSDDVEVSIGESPEEAIARIISSRDMVAASYAIRDIYGGVANQEPVNPTLTTLLTVEGATFKIKLTDAAHKDSAYTEKSFYALAYLDAVTQAPVLLDNPEIARLVMDLANQGEEYRNKLFAVYVKEAHDILSTEAAGGYQGIAENYQRSIETLYAYVSMASLTDAQQTEKINAIKAEEERIAEEERRKAEEEKRERERQREETGVEMPEMPTETQMSLRAADMMIERGGVWTNRGIVMKYFLEKGFTPAQISGVLGNLIAESGVDPKSHQYGGGPGRGIAQWGSKGDPRYDRFGYDGKRGLVLFAAQQGKQWDDIYVQLDFIMYEFSTTEKRAYAALKAATTAQQAAFEFEDKYERAGIPRMDVRYKNAADVFAAYDELLGEAKTQLMDDYKKKKKSAEEEIERRIAEEKERQAEEERRKAEEERKKAEQGGDIRSQLQNGLAIAAELKAKYNNVSGKLSDDELESFPAFYNDGTPITARLNPDAAKGYKAMAAAYKAHFGVDLRLTDHYRDFAAQVRTKKAKGVFAATPGKSNHGWGLALDLAGGINIEGSPAHEWMEQNAHLYGWVNPPWAHDGRAVEEPWHWEYHGNQAEYATSN